MNLKYNYIWGKYYNNYLLKGQILLEKSCLIMNLITRKDVIFMDKTILQCI